MRHPLLVVFLVAGACARTPPAKSPELPEVAAFRAALADPARHPLRQGLTVDEARLKEAVARFRDEHRELLARSFQESLDALPAGAPPADGYGVVAETPAAEAPALTESTGFVYALYPDATHLARMAINMFVPILAREAGMSISTIGPWISFIGAAAPALRRCETGAERAAVCLDYGGLDVFVVTFVKQASGWAVTSVAWRQRGRAAR